MVVLPGTAWEVCRYKSHNRPHDIKFFQNITTMEKYEYMTNKVNKEEEKNAFSRVGFFHQIRSS